MRYAPDDRKRVKYPGFGESGANFLYFRLYNLNFSTRQ